MFAPTGTAVTASNRVVQRMTLMLSSFLNANDDELTAFLAALVRRRKSPAERYTAARNVKQAGTLMFLIAFQCGRPSPW